MLTDRLLQSPEQAFHFNNGRVQNDDNELLAAEAADQIVGPKALAQQPGELLQNHVSRGVTVGVIDRLEMVQVENADKKLATVAVIFLAELQEAFGQVGAIVEAGQGIVDRYTIELCLRPPFVVVEKQALFKNPLLSTIRRPDPVLQFQ